MTAIIDPLRDALADRYTIERELGRGAMATVYLARDLRHGRDVAIKVMDRDVTGSVSVDRFLQEIRLMATLQHPHILPLFDSGDAVGRPYYVMPRVEGETLRAKLNRSGRLHVDEAIRIAREVASALDFAHRAGVVHRDIKPENILLSDGHALVADFGIARALLPDQPANRLTGTGMAIGTPGYMSPEQAVGDPVDGRTDLYALGAVTYEMLAGLPPFTGPTAQAILARVLTEVPADIVLGRPEISGTVNAAVQKALAREPAERFTTSGEFVRALETSEMPSVRHARARRRRPAVLLFAGAVTIAVALAVWRARTPASEADAKVRVAVVPFRESGDGGKPGFVAGLTDALRADLATLPQVDVIAGTTIAAVGDSARGPRFLAEQFGATHVLSGTVEWQRTIAGEVHARVVPELIDVSGGRETVRTGAAIDVALEDLFETQARVSSEIAAALGVPLSAEAATRLAKPLTHNRAAYEAYLRASTPNEERESDLLLQAVTLDSMFASAWARLGKVNALRYQDTFSPVVAELAERASKRALALDSSSAEAHIAMVLYERHVARDFEAAVAHGLAALKRAPGDADMMHITAAAMLNAHRIDDALALARKGAALDPRNPSAVSRVAFLLVFKHDYAGASEQTGRAMRLTGHRGGFINIDSIWLPLMRGDLIAAHAFTASLPDSTGRAVTGIFTATQWYQAWAIDSLSLQYALRRLKRTGPVATYLSVAVNDAWLRHDARAQVTLADSAIRALRERLDVIPREERLRMQLAYAYAFAGRCPTAIAQADSANATRSIVQDGFIGAGISLQLAELLAICGKPDRALSVIDMLLRRPGIVTPGWLRVDPYFAGLRAEPRFKAMLGQ